MGLFAKAESLRDPADEPEPAPQEVVAGSDGGGDMSAPVRKQGLLSRTQSLAQPARPGGLLRRSRSLAEPPGGTHAPPAPVETPVAAEAEPMTPTEPKWEPEPLDLGEAEVTAEAEAAVEYGLEAPTEPAEPSEPDEAMEPDEPTEPEWQPEPLDLDGAETTAEAEVIVEYEPETSTEPVEAAGPVEPPEILEAQPIPPPPRRTLQERLAAVSTEILDARVGLEAPGVLFALLQRHFGLRRAAILVPDAGREMYAPWAADGLDRTSLRRLRLDREATERLEAGVAEGEGLAAWLKRFSTRDASGIERIHHWPCKSDEGVSAVIIAAEIEPELESDPVFRDNLPEILQAAGHALADRRERELKRVQASGTRNVTAAPEQVIAEALGSAAQREAVLVRLTLSPLLTEAARTAPAIDRFRLTQDIALMLAHFTRETAEVVIAASPEELYLLFHGAKSPDADLWVHALLLALGPLLPSLERIPELPARSIRYPKEGTTALALMSSLG